MIPLAVKLSGNDTNVVEQLAAWTAFAGQAPAHILTFGSQDAWSSSSGEFIWAAGMLRYLKAGAPLVVSIPMCPDLPGAIAEVAAGQRDGEFNRAAKALAGRVQWLRIGWECNGKGFGWARKATDAQYVAAWNRITDLFLAVSPDFRFIQNFLADPQDGTASFSRLATRNLHMLSLDLYYYPEFTSDYPSAAFAQYRDGKVGLESVRIQAVQRNLPWAICEAGARTNSGEFVDRLADYLEAVPTKPVWLAWWDSNSGFRSRISDGQSGSTGERFKARFGPVPPDPKDQRISELEAEVSQLTTRLAEALVLTTAATERAQDAEDRLARMKALWDELNRSLA